MSARPPRSSTAGVTLLELLFVLGIIGTLVALAQVSYSSYRNTVAIAQAVSDLESISTAIGHGTLTEGFAPPPTLASEGTVAQGSLYRSNKLRL